MMGSLPATDVVDEAAGWLGWWALRRGRTGPVARVADRAAWVPDEAARRHLTDKAGTLLARIGA